MKTKTLKQKGGDCGCGNPIMAGQSGGSCSSCSKMEGGGGGFTIDPTSYLPHSQETYYPLNSYDNDTMMQTDSTRMTGVPISNNLNVTGGNDIKLGGGKKRKRKSKKSKLTKKKNTKKKRKRTKKQKGGINLGYIGQNSLLGHGQYGTWFGAPTNNTPDWNASIFTSPVSQNTTGYTEHNPYLV